MPNKAATELRSLMDDELRTKLRESREELFNLRFQTATGQLDNHRRLRTLRRDMARIYTVLHERELGLAAAPGTTVEEEAGSEE
jgi:large subunit ribosomal protein L29